MGEKRQEYAAQLTDDQATLMVGTHWITVFHSQYLFSKFYGTVYSTLHHKTYFVLMILRNCKLM